MDHQFEEYVTKLSTQNVRYKRKGAEKKGSDPYPWLDEDDPRRHMTDEEILYKYVDLSESHLTESEKEEVMDLVISVITGDFNHLLMKCHFCVWTHFYTPKDKS